MEACGDGAAAAAGARAGSNRAARYGRESGGERGERGETLGPQGTCISLWLFNSCKVLFLEI